MRQPSTTACVHKEVGRKIGSDCHGGRGGREGREGREGSKEGRKCCRLPVPLCLQQEGTHHRE